MNGEARLLAACRRRPVDRTPVWFMRQAGRCLAGYRELRERYDILEITRTPELCAQVTAMPVEVLGVDGAVLYADIMLPLDGMGVPFRIEPEVGPIVEAPVRDQAAVAALRVVDAEEATPELFETIRMLRRELAGRAAVIGFAGAPYTLASYLIEGRPSREHARAKALLYGEPALWRRLMETLTEVTIRYLQAQVAAGAQVVQLFDSWMGDLGRRDRRRRPRRGRRGESARQRQAGHGDDDRQRQPPSLPAAARPHRRLPSDATTPARGGRSRSSHVPSTGGTSLAAVGPIHSGRRGASRSRRGPSVDGTLWVAGHQRGPPSTRRVESP